MKLYFAPRTRAVRPRWLLEELEVPYELVRLDLAKEENGTPAFVAISPFRDVPALVDGELTLFDSSAICLHLADRFPEKRLAPPPGSPERGLYYQWLLFAEGRLESAVLAFYGGAPPPEARARLDEVLGVVDAALDGRDFLVAGHFTAADVVMASILHLAHHLKLLEGHPRVTQYVQRHSARPAVRRAVA